MPSATLEETICSADGALQASDPVAQDTRLLTIAEQEYVIIINSNNELFQVPVNSEEYRSAAGPENHDIFQTSTSPSTRIEDMMESLSESEWDDTKSLSLGELVEFFKSAQSTAYTTDVETETLDSYIPLVVNSRLESHILVAHGLNLTSCQVEAESEARKFCIERVSITDNIQAELIGSLQYPDDESDLSTERAPSEDLPPKMAGEPSILREMMSRYGTNQPKEEMKLRALVRFLLLIDACGLNAEEEYLSEAKRWVSLLHPSQTFDEDAVPWLWVMWKLHMKSEFKQLSSIVQQEARTSILQWQDGPDNRFGIKLPRLILDQLDGKRLRILSEVKNRMASEIRKHRRECISAIEKYGPWSIGVVMRSSFAFGYLTLQSNMWFDSQGDRRQLNVADFLGVNFVDLKEGITSMQELGDWKVCTVPLADLMPTPLAMLAALVPVVGVGLHHEGLHVRFPVGFKAELLDLISEIEKEGWGIDLVQGD
ncbi:hypothetical protein CcaCcLH18_08120 [Colletotrichum camelliae]|nr:hypothetical protein CcaCcLH18_08120 [Colletotrichum camelliae]